MRFIRLIIDFYKSFALLSFLITLSSVIIVYANGYHAFTILFWFKIITVGLIFYYINDYKRAEFYYFKNLGLTKRILWTSTIFFDMTLYIILIILTIKFR